MPFWQTPYAIMPDILRVTTPVSNQDTTIRPRPDNPAAPDLPNIPDPTRVPQTNQQNVSTDQQNRFSAAFQSNYDKFVQLLRTTPELAQSFGELFYTKLGNFVNAGINENFAQEIAQFFDMLKMDEAQMLAFLKGQCETAVKFGGPFFNTLRELLESDSASTKDAMLDLLRKLNSLVSGGHVLNELASNLKSITQYMTSQYADELTNLINQLTEHPNGQNGQNLDLLKGQILPFLANFVAQTHDYGSVRDQITMFMLNLARYESGSSESLMQSFQNAISHPEIAAKLAGLTPDALVALFSSASAAPNQEALEHLVNIIARGMRGEAGMQNIASFESILQAMLVNESVYMPLLHVMLPVNLNGSYLFSEMWVDPEAEGEGRNGGTERYIKMLIKVDIKNVGYFEMILLYGAEKVDLQLYYPPALESKKDDIRAGIREIAARNNLSLQSFISEQVVKPKAISSVFPKIYERKNAIHVVV